jgi:hypothetical protein
LHPILTKLEVIRGSSYFGMSDTIQHYVLDCGGMLVYTQR